MTDAKGRRRFQATVGRSASATWVDGSFGFLPLGSRLPQTSVGLRTIFIAMCHGVFPRPWSTWGSLSVFASRQRGSRLLKAGNGHSLQNRRCTYRSRPLSLTVDLLADAFVPTTTRTTQLDPQDLKGCASSAWRPNSLIRMRREPDNFTGQATPHSRQVSVLTITELVGL